MVVVQNPTHLALPMPGEPLAGEHMLLKSFIAAGIPLALGSDGGPKEQNPLLNLMLATLHPGEPTEAISREAALIAYTAGGAYAEGQDQRKGRIAPGACCRSRGAVPGCIDHTDAAAAGDYKPANASRWRSDLRRCDVDITPLVGMSALGRVSRAPSEYDGAELYER